LLPLISILATFGSVRSEDPDEDITKRYSVCNPDLGSVYQFTVETLDGKNTSMDRYSGNVLLIVNVATF